LVEMQKAASMDNQLFQWQMPPEHPAISTGEIHLWRVNLEMMRKLPGSALLLSQSEKERYRRLVSPRKRDDFCAARAALRMILGGYLQLLPRALGFGYSASRKPYLVNPSFGQDLCFNLSHSGKWMLLGVCLDAELGVDIEEVRMVNQSWALSHLFSEEERELINNLEITERANGFTRLWTKKEAAAKADGTGLARYASQLRATSPSGIKAETQRVTRENGLWVMSFEPTPGFFAAAAVNMEEAPRVKFYEFNPNF